MFQAPSAAVTPPAGAQRRQAIQVRRVQQEIQNENQPDQPPKRP